MEINENKIIQLAKHLANTCNTDSEIRNCSEKYLENYLHNENSEIFLLRIIERFDFDESMKLAAAIFFKNGIQLKWNSMVSRN